MAIYKNRQIGREKPSLKHTIATEVDSPTLPMLQNLSVLELHEM